MRLFTSKSVCIAICTIAVNFCCSFAAADTLDQLNNEDGTVYFVDQDLDLAQSFTVGISGQLTRVDLFIGKEATAVDGLTFDLRTASISGAPSEANSGSNILASETLSAASVPTIDGWQTFDISGAGVFVPSGDVLAVTLRSDDAAGGYRWLGANNNPYTSGLVSLRPSGAAASWQVDPFIAKDVDLAFRTFVVIPEPSSVLVLSVFAGIAASRRRRAQA